MSNQSAARVWSADQPGFKLAKTLDDMKRGLSKEQIAEREKAIKDAAEKNKKRNELNQAFNDGMAAMQAKQYDVAITNFEKAAESDPTQTVVWAQLGDAHIKMAEGKTGPDFDAHVQKAIESYNKAVELKPDDPAASSKPVGAAGQAPVRPSMKPQCRTEAVTLVSC